MSTVPQIQFSCGNLMLDETIDQFGSLITKDSILTNTGDFIAVKNSDKVQFSASLVLQVENVMGPNPSL